jgi:hypothetical protein
MKLLLSSLILIIFGSSSSLAFTPSASSHNTVSSSLSSSSNDDDVIDCLVLGGGISGSTLAHNLDRLGVNMVLAEARDYLGGNVKSHRTSDGFLWEEGPNSFATQPSIVRIAYELGISDQLVFADESLPPWVNHNGKLHPLPKGQGGKGPKGQIELVFRPNGVLKFALPGCRLDKIKIAQKASIRSIMHCSSPQGLEPHKNGIELLEASISDVNRNKLRKKQSCFASQSTLIGARFKFHRKAPGVKAKRWPLFAQQSTSGSFYLVDGGVDGGQDD